MRASLVVPYSTKDITRKTVWSFLRRKWKTEYPQFPIVRGKSDDPEWCKGEAVADALSKVETEISIIIDSDVWIPGIDRVIEHFVSGTAWVKPHRRMVRLTQQATERVFNGEPIEVVGEERTSWARRPYAQALGGACVVLRTEDALKVPIDCRFKGWGGEDISWARSLYFLLGAPTRERCTAYHLWHEPAEHLHHEVNAPLASRYKRAQHLGQIKDLLQEPGATLAR